MRLPERRCRTGRAAAWLPIAFCIAFAPRLVALECAPAAPPPLPAAHAATLPNSTGTLWSVTRPGIPSSHVLGTIHLSDPRVAPGPAVAAQVRAARLFVLEVLFDETTLARVGAVFRGKGASTLARVAPADLLSRTTTLLQAYGVPPDAAGELKPWAAWTTLALPPAQATAGPPLDLALLALARAASVPAVGLETLEEQVAVFDAAPMPDQIALLTDAVCHPEMRQAAVERLIDAWQHGDLATLHAEASTASTPEERRFTGSLLHERNARLANRLLPLLAEGGVFVAVGAAHLPGTDGVLARLAAAGFDVTPVR